MDITIHQAIKARNIIRFEFEGRFHIGEPHAYITCQKGDEYVEVFQFCGVHGRWIILPLHEVSSIRLLEKLHFEPRDDEIFRPERHPFRTICQA